MNLQGKIAFVTGGGKGIGQGIALALAQCGAHVAINYNSSAQGAEETLRMIEDIGGQGLILQGDVSGKAAIESMFAAAAEHFGGLDILVNNAALQTVSPLLDYKDEEYDVIMGVNLKGYFQCVQTAARYMKRRGGGRIVNISSVHAKRPTDFDTVYGMTKGGIKMMTREAAVELARDNITINTIEPGYIDIGKKTRHPKLELRIPKAPASVNASSPPPGPKEIDRRKNPIGIIGQPSDVASLVCYLCSDENRLMTGASIRLDGGTMLV